MTLQALFLFFSEHQTAIVLLILIAPWITWSICVLIPRPEQEPLILSANLGLAMLSLLGTIGYLTYATNQGGWTRVIQEADLLLLLAPFYYVGVSLWVSRQRLPLTRIPAFRVVQGLAMIAAAYLLLSWLAAQIRIIFFSYIPLAFFLLLLAALVGLAYLGYLRLTGDEEPNSFTKTSQQNLSNKPINDDVEAELERLRRQMKKRNK